MDYFKLNDGSMLPALGFGVFLVPGGGPCEKAVSAALDAGYRLIDTAAAYMNEEDVGRAMKKSGVARKDIFLTTKLWVQDNSYEGAKAALMRSMENLDVDYLDLYLIHQPYGDLAGAWKAMEEAKAEGLVRSIGVSNQTPRMFEEFLSSCDTAPAINQVECNPFFQQRALKESMAANGTRLMAWYPLGHANKELFEEPQLNAIARAHGKDVGQVMLRWHIQEGNVAIPRATSSAHIAGNIDVFDFELSADEMDAVRSLDTGKGTHDPEDKATAQRLMGFKIHD